MKQIEFFRHVMKTLEIEKSSTFKTTISKLLDITESGAYKKINGLTQLTLLEMNKICDQTDIDISFNPKDKDLSGSHPFTFHCDDLITPPQTYEQWASNILNHSLLLDKFKPDYKVISYQSEISYFHLLPFKSLLYFKLYAWNRSSWKITSRNKFNLSEFRQNYALNSLLDSAAEHFVSYKSVEIWHIDFLDGLLSQLRYYYKLKIFENKNDLLTILKEIKKMVLHLEEMSKDGKKKIFGQKESDNPIDIYVSYIHTSASVMYIESTKFRMIYNLFLHPNYIRSQDEYVCDYTEQWLKKVVGQSELISGSGEIIRKNFFNELTEKISILLKEIGNEF